MAKKYIGVDVGGNKIGVGIIKKNKVIKFDKFQTQAKAKNETIINNIIKSIHAVKGNQKVKGIGIGIAGEVDYEKGIFIGGPNFSKKFENIELAKIIKKEFKTKTMIDNDANCFTMAEAAYGQGEPYKHIIGITLGTGIGGGVVIDGMTYRGKNGLAGEIGHIIINDLTFEKMAAGNAMIKLYKKQTNKTLNTFEIEELAKKKNKDATKIFNLMTNSLAQGLANIIHFLNPEIIVIGGGLIRVPLLIKPAIKKVKNYLAYNSLKQTKIVTSKLGDKANVLGATILFK